MNMILDLRVPVALPPSVMVIKGNDNYVTVEGTWARTDLTNDSIANPLQTSRIVCVKSENHCYQSTASVSTNPTTAGFNSILLTDFDEYQVTSWTENSIIFSDEALCAITIYTIDLNTETVSGAGHKIKEDTQFCHNLASSPASHEHWGFLLKNGFDVYWEMRQKARPYPLRLFHSFFGN